MAHASLVPGQIRTARCPAQHDSLARQQRRPDGAAATGRKRKEAQNRRKYEEKLGAESGEVVRGGGREVCGILNSHLSRLLPGRPAALMKTSEQTDSPSLQETEGREGERESKRRKQRDGRAIMK